MWVLVTTASHANEDRAPIGGQPTACRDPAIRMSPRHSRPRTGGRTTKAILDQPNWSATRLVKEALLGLNRSSRHWLIRGIVGAESDGFTWPHRGRPAYLAQIGDWHVCYVDAARVAGSPRRLAPTAQDPGGR
jgi:hypothetical protein